MRRAQDLSPHPLPFNHEGRGRAKLQLLWLLSCRGGRHIIWAASFGRFARADFEMLERKKTPPLPWADAASCPNPQSLLFFFLCVRRTGFSRNRGLRSNLGKDASSLHLSKTHCKIRIHMGMYFC